MTPEEFAQNLEKMGWPQEFNEKLEIGNLKSNLGIATLWSFKEVVSRNLDRNDFAVLGNYYDRRNGLEPLVRNCLANPNIRYIILLGNDKAQSREVLVNFFEKGFDEKGFVVGTDARIPRGIPAEDLNKLRENVKLIDVTDKISNKDDSEEYSRVIKEVVQTLEKKSPYAEPKLYEKPKLETDSFPSEKVGFVVRGEKVGEVWLKLLHHVYNYGSITKMKVKDTEQIRVLTDVVSVISNEDADEPKMEPYFRFTEDYLKSYYDEICSPRIPEGTLYTYGSRLRAWEGKNGEKIDQVKDVIEYLKPDILRTSGVMQTWIVEDELTRRYLNKDKNSPCIVLIHPFAPDGKLHMTAYIRSNDMFRAWPLNAFGLRKLQKIIAEGLEIEIGDLVIISSSAHIYQDCWTDTKEILKEHYKDTNCFFDPRGYYAINLNQGKIKVEHFSPDSQLLKEYFGKTAREINDAINSSQHPVDSYHSSYLGEELMKAQIALENGLEYVQDSPIKISNVKTTPSGDACAVDSNSSDSCSTDSCEIPENSIKINLEKDETYLEKEIEKLEEIFREHITESDKRGKDLFEHWKKPKWDEYFMSMAVLISMRSIDPSQKNGCVIVDENNKVLSIGYNGFPRGSQDEIIPLTRPEKFLFIEHAEKNAILNKQFDIKGSTLYVTAHPCLPCVRSIIQSGVKRVVYLDKIKARSISPEDEGAIKKLMVGRKDLILDRFEKDPLECLYKSIEYYKIKKMSKEKK
ncbi:MAG: thymidylate synthase [archaeon]